MRKCLIGIAVIVAVLLSLTIAWGQAQNPDDSVIAQLTRKLLAQEQRIAQQDFVINKMSEIIQASTDSTLVGKLKAMGIQIQ